MGDPFVARDEASARYRDLAARARADEQARRHRAPRPSLWRRLFPPTPEPTRLDYAVAEALAPLYGGQAWKDLPGYVRRARARRWARVTRLLLQHGLLPDLEQAQRR